MTPILSSYLCLDDQGRAWIKDKNVKVIEVALDKVAYGWSPEEIFHQHYGYLSLAEIYGALAHYYEHQAEFDTEIERQVREAEALLAEQGTDTSVHKKLLT